MKTRLEIGSLFVVVLLAQGCGVIPGKGAGGGSDGGADGGSMLGACNTPLVNAGAVISKTSHAGAPPTMTGGTIADGTYFLTAIDKYNGHSATTTLQETWVVSGSTIAVVGNDSSRTPSENRASGTFATSGTNNLTFTITCPQAGTSPTIYTATPTQLQTQDTTEDDHEVHTYTKQ